MIEQGIGDEGNVLPLASPRGRAALDAAGELLTVAQAVEAMGRTESLTAPAYTCGVLGRRAAQLAGLLYDILSNDCDDETAMLVSARLHDLAHGSSKPRHAL